jgi:hypothetical protein
MKVVSFEERIVASLIHTCRATPRRRTTTVPASLMTAQLSRRFNAQQLTLHCQPGMDREQRTLSVRVRTPRLSNNNRWRWGWPSSGWWHSQAFSKSKSTSLPGDRQREDLGPVCPLADTPHRIVPCAFRCWSWYIQQHSETQTKQLPAVAVFRARESSLHRRLVRRCKALRRPAAGQNLSSRLRNKTLHQTIVLLWLSKVIYVPVHMQDWHGQPQEGRRRRNKEQSNFFSRTNSRP